MKIFLKKNVILTPEKEKTNILLPFDVPKGIGKLLIDFSYSPKELENKERSIILIKENLIRDGYEDTGEYSEFLPLKNLVTLSLDSPEGYVGSAHRQSPKQCFEISPDFVSPGFDKSEIYEGEWILTLNLHALVTDKCVCEVEVRGYE